MNWAHWSTTLSLVFLSISGIIQGLMIVRMSERLDLLEEKQLTDWIVLNSVVERLMKAGIRDIL